ncbi:unnamed protein product [Durusdinium trenchii]|uniref:PDZ domain-containing protein n=1 Tax=Durusdinium trenchii TaxID=1381693 RepID=A0ABP0NAY4_9DINO
MRPWALVLLLGCLSSIKGHRQTESMLALTEDSPERFDRGEKEEEVKSKISNFFESVSAAEPMGADQEGVKSTTQAGRTQDRTRDLWLTSERVIHMQPGQIGLWLDLSTGMIQKVYEGTQAERLGFQVGDYITKVGTAGFNLAAYQKATKQQSGGYDITIESPSQVARAAQYTLLFLLMPAGMAGCLLMLFLPYIISQGLFGPDVDSKTLTQPAAILLFGTSVAYALGIFGGLFLNWRYSGLGYKMKIVGETIGFSGLVMGLCFNRCNALLKVRLRRDTASELRSAYSAALVLPCGVALFRFVGQLWRVWPEAKSLRSTALLHVFYGVSDVPNAFLVLLFTSLTSGICTTARQRMLEVSEGLPCEATQFAECVHKPCAELLLDIPANLAPCGLPILLLIVGIVPAFFRFYETAMNLVVLSKLGRGLPQDWCDLGYHAFMLAGFTLAAAIGPLQLSWALRDFQRRLADARRLDSNMHVQVQVNDGKGWGIPVFEGFVLTKSVMQTLCLRLLLAGTVIKAFLDTELGFHQEEKERSRTQLATIVDGLHNMTGLLKNQSINLAKILDNHTL